MVARIPCTNRIFKLFALVSAGGYLAARLRRRTSAPTHTVGPDFRGITDLDPEALRDAHARPAVLRERPRKNLP